MICRGLVIIFLSLQFTLAATARSQEVIERQIESLGAWASDNANAPQTTYVRLLGDPVGPTECPGNTLKIDFRSSGKSGEFTKSLLISAAEQGNPVRFNILTTCLYGNPTFDSAWVKYATRTKNPLVTNLGDEAPINDASIQWIRHNQFNSVRVQLGDAVDCGTPIGLGQTLYLLKDQVGEAQEGLFRSLLGGFLSGRQIDIFVQPVEISGNTYCGIVRVRLI